MDYEIIALRSIFTSIYRDMNKVLKLNFVIETK